MKLNPAQKRAVDAREGQWQILAGPGAGKTAVLVARYKALVSEGIKPEEIISLTFTKKAADEMRKRAEIKAESRGHRRPFGFCTFHSLALSFADLERESFPFQLAPFPLATPGIVAKSAFVAIRRHIPGMHLKDFLSRISQLKRDGIDVTAARNEAKLGNLSPDLAEAYHDHEQYLQQQGLLDFDSLMLACAKILSTNSAVRNRWQYQYVMQDESQDADLIQWSVLRSISSKHGNVFCVGDGNQAIYAWRGAHPEIFIDKFSKIFPGAQRICLGQNYRSTPQIVSWIKECAPIQNELIDHFSTDNPAGEHPIIIPADNYLEEVALVCDRISALPDNGKRAAILARTNGYLRLFEEELSQRGIKYRLLGKAGYWQQAEVKNTLAFIQCAVFPSDSAVLTALRSPFPCTRYIRKKEICAALGSKNIWENLRRMHHANNQQQNSINGFIFTVSNLRRYAGLPAGDAVPAIINELQILKYYNEEELTIEADNDPAANVLQLIKVANRFDTLQDFLSFAHKVSGASRNRTGVAIGTIHAAKGLEFDHVFVVGASEGVLPHKNSDNIDEEARIYFVAVSRAAKTLHISYAGKPSRFIKEASIKNILPHSPKVAFSLLN